jgi:hypothetical protein
MWKMEIVDKAAAAAQQRDILNPVQRLADETMFCHENARGLPPSTQPSLLVGV